MKRWKRRISHQPLEIGKHQNRRSEFCNGKWPTRFLKRSVKLRMLDILCFSSVMTTHAFIWEIIEFRTFHVLLFCSITKVYVIGKHKEHLHLLSEIHQASQMFWNHIAHWWIHRSEANEEKFHSDFKNSVRCSPSYCDLFQGLFVSGNTNADTTLPNGLK